MVSVLHGTDKGEVLRGGADEAVLGKGGDDVIYGGSGHNVALSGGEGNDTIFAGNDGQVLRGDAGNDVLIGGSGNDNIVGGTGNDTLRGGAGNDLLSGGLGNDNLTGGTGADIFQFNYLKDATLGSDTIVDFTLGLDYLQIYGSVASPGVAKLFSTVSDFQGLIDALNVDIKDGSYASLKGDAVWLRLGGGNTIVLNHLNAGGDLTGLVLA